ncbi:peptidoglycan synthetase [Bacteroidia bacterium]|nr:peptidoglycan synthetase [Bacteroidia bacterium]
MKRYHFIAIGGSAMHNLAIALHLKGCKVTGSDDEIFDPAKSRLQKYGILPDRIGWQPELINTELDAVILGMHARADNPELLRALELGIRVFSYPEFLYEQSRNKTRIVIGGSHGKTTVTAMILHVLYHVRKSCDYMVGAQLEGFEVMVKLSEDAPMMVIEGDEYLTSPIDPRPKFHVYKPDIALINGIAWDHVNVFPSFDSYVEQFRLFADQITPNGALVYYSGDDQIVRIARQVRPDIKLVPYQLPSYNILNGRTHLITENHTYPLQVFGKHNLQNICGAWAVCKLVGVTDTEFLEAISLFKGASKRLELVRESANSSVFKDFAHSPSKLKATVTAVKEQFPDRTLVACMELHTFSSLTASFLNEYKGAFDRTDEAIVYFNPHAIAHKKLPELTVDTVRNAFDRPDIRVFDDSAALQHYLQAKSWNNTNLLLMSSGNFDGLQL